MSGKPPTTTTPAAPAGASNWTTTTAAGSASPFGQQPGAVGGFARFQQFGTTSAVPSSGSLTFGLPAGRPAAVIPVEGGSAAKKPTMHSVANPPAPFPQPPAGRAGSSGIGITRPPPTGLTAGVPHAPAARPVDPLQELDRCLNRLIAHTENQQLEHARNVERINQHDQQLLQHQRGFDAFNRHLQQLEQEKEAFFEDVKMVIEMQAGMAEELNRLEEMVKQPLHGPPAVLPLDGRSAEQKRVAASQALADAAVQFDEVEDQLDEAAELLQDARHTRASTSGQPKVTNLHQIRRILNAQWKNINDVEKETDLLAEKVQQCMKAAANRR
ncbi:hypothetical protein M3Y99_01179800 [Aphelenchoides fujianensis]|nr:hypothetical protein M3Y99_01179800 [Aphelenchoides fujianensis]